MRIILASAVVPLVRGGAVMLLDWLAAELRERGHDVDVIRLPFDSDYTQMPQQMVGMRLIDVTSHADRLITLRTPSHLLRHPTKVVWFLHHHRPAFDLWGTEYQDLPDSAEGRGYREMFRAADTAALTEAHGLFCNSATVRDRVQRYNGLDAEVLYPPVHRPERFRTDAYDDFIFYPSRLTGHKRQWLAIAAMAHTQTPVRLVVAGALENQAYGQSLRDLIRDRGVGDRVELRTEFISETEKVDLLARCLAVAYMPFDEDSYGYPSLEAHHANKAVVSAHDSGGTKELIIPGHNGFLEHPEPVALARRFDELYEDRALAERMGTNGARRLDEMSISWDNTIARLLA